VYLPKHGFQQPEKAVDPIDKDFEKYLLDSLIDELNNLFPVCLSTDFVCDRYTDSDVFDEHSMERMALVLIGESNLRQLARFIQQEEWKVFDLTTPGWRV
jgi:hypothetical protein